MSASISPSCGSHCEFAVLNVRDRAENAVIELRKIVRRFGAAGKVGIGKGTATDRHHVRTLLKHLFRPCQVVQAAIGDDPGVRRIAATQRDEAVAAAFKCRLQASNSVTWMKSAPASPSEPKMISASRSRPFHLWRKSFTFPCEMRAPIGTVPPTFPRTALNTASRSSARRRVSPPQRSARSLVYPYKIFDQMLVTWRLLFW
jgi:hypothetical protein